MIVRKLGVQSITKVDEMLQEERVMRLSSQRRDNLADISMLYEPKECFSYHSDENLGFITNKDDFKNYREKNNIPLIQISRSGGMIWHGPGQIILEAIVDLRRLRMSISDYIATLEHACLETVQSFGMRGEFRHYIGGAQGVWVRDPNDGINKEVAFLGFNVSRGVAIHGCAINLSCDLYPFSLIWPCDLRGVRATSLQAILGAAPAYDEIEDTLINNFEFALNETTQ